MTDPRTTPPRRKIAFLGPMHPHTGGGGQFNTALVTAFRELGPVVAINWKRLYPPILAKRVIRDRPAHDLEAKSIRVEEAQTILDWPDPRSWRRALQVVEQARAQAMILTWLHPVTAPPYRYLLTHAPRGVARLIICHNVLPHEMFTGARALTRAVFSQADVLVTQAPQQRAELQALGVRDVALHETFHPRFPAESFAPPPPAAKVAAERARLGSPDLLLLVFGAIRPYKGVDIALEALASLHRSRLRVKLVIAGACWDGGEPLAAQIARLGLADIVDVRNRFVSHEEAALLFSAADASLLPYRSATQSGVVQLSFSYGTPVIATRVGGLPFAIADGTDGILCEPEDPAALAAAITDFAARRGELAGGVRANDRERSAVRYAELVHEALDRYARGELPRVG